MDRQSRPILRLKFAQSSTWPSPSEPPKITRPPRAADASDASMRDYMTNLEARLIRHVQRHATTWIDREAGKILRKWHAPILQPPRPGRGPSRDFIRDARRYAEDLVMGRIEQRLKQFQTIRQTRGFVFDPVGDRHRAVQLTLRNKQD